MKEIGLHGSFFGDNFGDTLFAVLTEEIILKTGNTPVVSYCSDRVLNQLKVPNKNFFKFICSEKIIFTGGGYFGEPSTRLLYWHMRFFLRHGIVLALCRVLRKRYIVAGVGAGPLKYWITRRFVSWVLKGAEGVYARDEVSVDFLSNVLKIDNIKYSADLVIKHVTVDRRDLFSNDQTLGEKRIIGLHVPLLKNFGSLDYLCRQLVLNSDKYRYVFFQDFHNPEFNSTARKTLDKAGVEYTEHHYAGTDDMLNFLASLDGVITVKLHVGIVSTCLGKPTLSMSVHEKATRYFKQIGYSELNAHSGINAEQSISRFFEMMDRYITLEIPNEVVDLSTSTFNEISDFIRS